MTNDDTKFARKKMKRELLLFENICRILLIPEKNLSGEEKIEKNCKENRKTLCRNCKEKPPASKTRPACAGAFTAMSKKMRIFIPINTRRKM